MPKLRRSTSHKVTVRGGEDDYFPTRHSVSTEKARIDAIRECLTELVGVELIYAIRCKDGAVKIGHTADLKNRRKFFDASPDAILGVRLGTWDEEQALHRELHASVMHGVEYYHPTPEVMAVVNAMREQLGVDALDG